MLTPRWLVFALICPVLLIAAAVFPVFAAVALMYGVTLGAITLLDRRAAGKADQFRVVRLHDAKLSLGVLNPIRIQIQSRAGRAAAGVLRDDAPQDFYTPDHLDPLVWSCPAFETTSITYHVRPLHRGKFAFGDLHVRWTSPLGLYTRQAAFPAAQTVQVYPNLYEIRKYELLVRRDQLTSMGLRLKAMHGEGTSFASLRDYTPDDPYRSINWKATARRGKPISTDYEPERSQRLMIGIDVGRMMRSPIRVSDADGQAWNMAKVDFVINAVLLLSYVAMRKGDQVGLLVFADRVQQFIPAEPGQAHFQKLLDAMYALESQPVEADYQRAMLTLKAQQKKRALTVIFTDVSGRRASDALAMYLPRLMPQHLPMLVTIRDPALDQESGQPPVDSDAVYRRAVAEQMLDERRLLMETLEQRGILTLDIDAQRLSMSVVNRYLQLKRRALL
ncbi:MAG: DUF58 domain-containing protein [Anaerolineae bacterium]